ncbi:hypothetical protein ACFX1X_028018 [Malus domestica]
MFLRQMWYLLWKHKMLKMSTQEQCQRYYREERKLSISKDSAKSALSDMKKNKLYPRKSGSRNSESGAFSVFEQAIMSGSGFRDLENSASSIFEKVILLESGSRDSEGGASSIFEHVILLGVWLSRFEKRCLFDF